MTDKFTPKAGTSELTKQAAAFMRAASDLVEVLSAELPAEKQTTMMQVLHGGGRVGLEVTVDRHASNLLRLVAVEREGRHFTLATVSVMASEKGVLAH